MGIVMISMTSSTSITSISGVVLMSIITSGCCPAPCPTLIAIEVPLARTRRRSAASRGRLGDEGDLRDAGALARVDDPADAGVFAAAVAADMHLGLRRKHRDPLQAVDQRGGRRDPEVVPVDVVLLVDRQHDVLRL